MRRVKEPHLRDAVHHAMSRRIEKGLEPTKVLFPGEGLVRAVAARYLINQATKTFDPDLVPANLAPRDAGTDANRFSGLGPQGKVSYRGGCYTSRHTSPMINEVLHYARKDPNVPVKGKFPDYFAAIREKGVIQARVTQPLLILDLSRYSPQTSSFLTALEHDPGVRSALTHSHYRGGRLELALFDDIDYSVARGIGTAVANAIRLDGLQVSTARPSDRKGETGDNVVLYGADGVPIRGVGAEKVVLFDPNTSDPIVFDV
jgi:hypothetical protein